jgi:hypothetical protein
MLKFLVEHVDDFGKGAFACWLNASEIPSEIIEVAKGIDKENYSKDCFGVCVNSETYDFAVSREEVGCELYYVDNDGNKHWLKYKLTSEESSSAIKLCKEYLGY